MSGNKFLIIGHARHGKDTFAQMICSLYGLTFKSSSEAAAEIFLFDELKEKYGYTTPEQCFADRVNHRAEWHNLICEYNIHDKARLAKDILKTSDIYVGMRSNAELYACRQQNVFKYIIAIYNPGMPHEDISSFDINIFRHADIVVTNNSNLEDLSKKVHLLYPFFGV